MKSLKNLILGLAIASALGLPSKQASAGVITHIGGAPIALSISLIGGGYISAVGFKLIWDGDVQDIDAKAIAGAMTFLVAGEQAQNFENTIAAEFSHIPHFAIEDAAKAFEDVALKTKNNARGLKFLKLSEEKASEIVSDIAYLGKDAERFKAFLVHKAQI